MSSCCLNQKNAEQMGQINKLVSERFHALIPSQKTMKSIVELLMIATAIISLALL